MSNNYLGRYFNDLVKFGIRSYNLYHLDLSSNYLENKHFKLIELLIYSLKNLGELDLSKNQISFHGVNAVFKGLMNNRRLKKLKYYDLQ